MVSTVVKTTIHYHYHQYHSHNIKHTLYILTDTKILKHDHFMRGNHLTNKQTNTHLHISCWVSKRFDKFAVFSPIKSYIFLDFQEQSTRLREKIFLSCIALTISVLMRTTPIHIKQNNNKKKIKPAHDHSNTFTPNDFILFWTFSLCFPI